MTTQRGFTPILGMAAALLAVAQSGAASAKPETGTRFDRAPGAVPEIDPTKDGAAAKATNLFSRCIANQRQRAAVRLLDLPLGGKEQTAGIEDLIGGQEDCIYGNLRLRFQPAAMIGGMAEGLIALRFKGADVAGLAAITDEQLDAAGVGPRTGAEDFATCIVRRDPAAAKALIDSEVWSDTEASQIQRLKPHLGGCLVAGSSLKLNAFAVRTHVAVGLYRLLSNAPKLTAARTAPSPGDRP
jgi:hypothetical protein